MNRDKNSGSAAHIVEEETLGRTKGSKRRARESRLNGATGGPTTPQAGQPFDMTHERRTN